MPYSVGHDPNRVNAMELLIGSFEDMKAEFYEVKYGEIQFRDVIPEASIDSSINPGATSTSYRVYDQRGKGSFRSTHDSGVPTVGQTLSKNFVPIEVAGVSALFDTEDARQIQYGFNQSLLSELPNVMRKACERHVEGTVFFGDQDVQGFLGWLDYPGVTVTVAPDPGAGTEWVNKTPDQILTDINEGISSVWNGTKQIHLPDTVYLPGSQLAYIAATRIPEINMTVLEFIKANNIYTALTGQPLNVKSIRYLDGSGAGATDRMVVAETKAENVTLPFPLPFDLLDPQERGFDVELYAEYKFGSFHMRYPASMIYVDGI